ncbi:MAG: tetratricopeptide repeat protein [Caldithrix sp.]|nr:tetratricopeptide repeat protein [Caldithrix sp.]
MKKTIFLIMTIFLPVLFFAALEGILRLSGYGTGYPLTHKTSDGRLVINRDYPRKFFSSTEIAVPEMIDQVLLQNPPQNNRRILCLGGSTTAGFPYEVNINFPYFIKKHLQKNYPGSDIEMINLGISAVNSHAVRHMLADVKTLNPDMVLIYMGHNEFYGALGMASQEYIGGNITLIQTMLHIREWRIYQLLQAIVRGTTAWFTTPTDTSRQRSLMQAMMQQDRIDPHGTVAETTFRNFEDNLLHILRFFKQHSIPVMISDVTCNIRDQMPLSGGNPRQNPTADRPAMKIDTMSVRDSLQAQILFETAQDHLAQGNYQEAYRRFALARDRDRIPFRAPAVINQIIHRSATKTSTPLVSMDSLFRARARYGIPGNDLFVEHVHPNAYGYRLMAAGFIRTLPLNDLNKASMHYLKNLYSALDEYIGALKIQNLIENPPFSQSTRFRMPSIDYPIIKQLARRHVYQNLYWDAAHFELGDYYADHQLPRKALQEYLIVTAFDSTHLTALYKTGNVYYKLRQWDAAIDHYEKAVAYHGRQSFLYAKLGKTYIVSDKNQQTALSYLKTAMEQHRQQPSFTSGELKEIYYLTALSSARLNRIEAAENYLNRSLHLDNAYQPALELKRQLKALSR